MIKYLLTQIGQIEDQQQSYKELNAKMRDIDADNVSKLENSFKKNNEVSGFQLQELTQKMRSLESQIEIAEQIRTEMREKLRVSEDNNQQMVSFIKSLQTQGDLELNSMRQVLQ